MEKEPGDLARLSRERDLYKQLLELGRSADVEAFLVDALPIIVEATGAGRAYLEIQDDPATPAGESPHFWVARGCSGDEVAAIRGSFSRGVIAKAFADGTIVTDSARTDPRLRDATSARAKGIEHVLCAPIGASPPIGVLYLQDRAAGGAFGENDRHLAEVFAAAVAMHADHLLLRRRLRDATDATRSYRRPGMDDIVGRSQALGRLLREVWVATPHDVSVLLTGPNGAGKSRIARLIHENSPRAKGPFVGQSCANLPEMLFESELFGHVRGAFTEAYRDKQGLVAAADGGTLFLDEIAEISMGIQAKLLDFLDSRTYRPVGGDKPRRADVRIIAATNADLKAAVEQGTFRQDLYYRLEVMPLAVPSLAERREDVPALCAHFCKSTVERLKLPAIQPSEGLIRAAEAAEWPGNVRELGHAVERAVLRANSEGLLVAERRHLFPEAALPAAQPAGGSGGGGKKPPGAAPPPPTFQDGTRAFQAELVKRTLDEHEWNVTKAAAQLDLTRAHLYNLIKAFGLARPRG
jgi:Nif-specific regulatory protein